LFDASDVNNDLTSYSVNKQVFSQAVIVCCVSRQAEGHWRIWEVGLETAGNGRNFEPIKTTIQQLIKEKRFPGISLEKAKPLWHYMNEEENKAYNKLCDNR